MPNRWDSSCLCGWPRLGVETGSSARCGYNARAWEALALRLMIACPLVPLSSSCEAIAKPRDHPEASSRALALGRCRGDGLRASRGRWQETRVAGADVSSGSRARRQPPSRQRSSWSCRRESPQVVWFQSARTQGKETSPLNRHPRSGALKTHPVLSSLSVRGPSFHTGPDVRYAVCCR